MVKKGFLFLFFSLLFVFGFAGVASAANWYVDTASQGTGDGTSWANARAFSGMGSLGIQPGDIVYIDGGSTSKTYSISSWAPISGTSGSPITYRVGQDAGHNGTVIFDGGNNGNPLISNTPQYVTFDGEYNGIVHWRFQNYVGSRYLGNSKSFSHLTFRYMEFHQTETFCYSCTWTAGLFDHCVFYKRETTASDKAGSDTNIFFAARGSSGFTNLVFDSCSFYYPGCASETAFSDDGFQWASNITVKNSFFKADLTTGYGCGTNYQHGDVFQCCGSNIALEGNTFEDVGESIFYMDCFSGSGSLTNLYIYNNVLYWTNQAHSGVARAFEFEPEAGGAYNYAFTNFWVANNILVDWSWGFNRINRYSTCTNCWLKNNIWPGITPDYETDTGTVIYSNNVSSMPDYISYTQYGGASNDLHLASSDTIARDQGADLSAYFTTDKEGVIRPQGSAWDIGAYEYTGNGPTDTIAPQVTAFSVAPTTITQGQSVTASYTVTDNTALSRVELWRAPQGTNCTDTVKTGCVWTQQTSANISGTSYSGTLTNTPASAGVYYYGLHAVDTSNNTGYEPVSAKVTVNAAQTTCGSGNCHYIRQGATGANNGSDWTNAWTALPATLTRGDTYYIADGSYGGYTYDDAESGNQYITIKKAIGSDHGTDVGWQSAYGDGQAVFENTGTVWNFETMYWDVDGITGSGISGYGIVIRVTGASSATYGISLRDGTGYLNLKHLEIYHSNPCGVGDVAQDGIRSVGPDNVTISHCYIHSWHRNCIIATNSQNWTVEHSYLAESHSTSDNHGQAIYMGYNASDNWTIRYNTFKDINGSAVVFFSGACSNVKIYGNLIWEENTSADCGNFSVGGVLGHNNSGGDVTGLNFYNNTMIGMRGRGSSGSLSLDSGTNNTAYNNIWYNSLGVGFNAITHDYNASDLNLSESHFVPITTNIFRDYTGNDFSLSGNFPANWSGMALSGPFNVDIYGNTRGADGVWDRGAYEYVSGSQTSCGDGACNGTETCSSCPSDCGSCTGDTTAPQVTAFSVTPTTITVGQSITASYTVTDNISLSRAELWRAPQGTNCNDTTKTGCVWTQQTSANISGTNYSGTLTNTPASAGVYYYGLHAVDAAGNVGYEPAPVKVTVNAAGTGLSVGTHNITVTVTDAMSNTAQHTIQITVLPAGTMAVNVNTLGGTYSQGDTINFSSSVYGGTAPYTYLWNSSLDGDFSTLTWPSIDTSGWSLGTHVITLAVTDSLGNTASDQVNIDIIPGAVPCVPDGCNGICPVSCSVVQDADCGCSDGDGCCGIGCGAMIDSDCTPPLPPPLPPAL